MKDFKCPMCDTSDFKDDNGYYVCQICDHKIPKENPSLQKKNPDKPKTQIVDKGVDKIIALVIFGFIAVSNVLSIIPNLDYYFSYGIIDLVFSLFCLIPMICFIVSTIRKMQGKVSNITGGKTIGFIFYAIGEAIPTILNMIRYGYFNIINILYTVFYIALVWVTVYKLEKWIKK